jgi:hypothetical protein
MKHLVMVVVAACAASPPPAPAPASPPTPVLATDVVNVDTPKSTSAGSTYVVPAGWSVHETGAMTVMTPPDGRDSHVVLIESTSADADAARDAAWKLYRPSMTLPIDKTDDAPGRNGWTQTRQYTYKSDDKHTVVLTAAFGGSHWAVAILDLSNVIMNLRAADLSTIFDHLTPKH